jgi:hypothetical protein
MLRVAWTGGGVAELVEEVPITARAGPGVVAMSLGRGRDADRSLPDLEPGDVLEVSAEVEVTTDLTPEQLQVNRGKGCHWDPYPYDPTVTATLVLAADGTTAAPAAGTQPIAGLRAHVSHDRHHHVFVFNRERISIPAGWRGRGAVNLVLAATHASAGARHCVLVGQNEPDGTVGRDMGGISVVRIRGRTPKPRVERRTELAATSIGIHGRQEPAVVYSLPLTDLRADEQLTVHAKLLVSARGLRTSGRLASRIFLADSPDQRDPAPGLAARIAAHKGRVTKRTGFNHLPAGPEVPVEKAGVLRVVEDLPRGETVYLNLVADAGDPEKRAKAADALALKPGGELRVRRFSPRAFG